MPLDPGSRLGPYEVVAPIGAGGMGEVYRARDARLGRDVAIKVLPAALALDPERLARFEREARMLAAVSHPGIAAIFGVEEANGSTALVMELVEGPTLAERIAQGPLPVDDVLSIARQLAEALEYAHDRNIIHRDLKPANVKLRPDGTVKVLDFGLARAIAAETSGSATDLAHSPTITERMTQAGSLLGTAAYMSPEQARGRSADRRADIWAFGAVLFELLSGRRAFEGETISETLAAVMRDEPDLAALPAGLSSRWRRLLTRCLAKDPRRRLQAMGEARILLEDLAADPHGEGPPSDAPTGARATASSAPRRRSRIPWLILGGAVLALVAVMIQGDKPPAAPSTTELSVVPAGGERVGMDVSYQPIAIAPDGKSIAYTTRVDGVLHLRIRRLDRREDTEIPGAIGARNLFFSPDSRWIGFFDTRTMNKVSAQGGSPVEIATSLQDRQATWLHDGTIVYAPDVTTPLYRIPESGGTPVAITTLDASQRERTHRFPSALDGGPWVVFTSQTLASPGGYDDASIDAVQIETGERRHLYKGARRAAWSPSGHLLLARGTDLYATPIHPQDPRITTDPVPVLAGISGDSASGASFFSVASDGTIAWLPGGEPQPSQEVVWVERSGRQSPSGISPGPYLGFKISPDGSRALVLAGAGGGSADIWLADLRTGALNRLTHTGKASPGVWLPDGGRFVYSRDNNEGGSSIVLRNLDGAGGEREIARSPNVVYVSGATPDGRSILFSDYGARKGRMYLAPLDGSAPPRELAAEGDGYEIAGTVASDGRWLAYLSTKTGREEVCLRRLDGKGGSWQVSNNEAGGIRWGRDGRELFFVSADSLMRLPLTPSADGLSIGQLEALFEVPPSSVESTFREYDYDPHRDRFLFTRPPKGGTDRREIAVSLQWAQRLK